MNHEDNHLDVIQSFAAAFGSRGRIPVETVKEYVGCLLDIPLPTLQAACAELKARSDWMPSIAEIRRTAFAGTIAACSPGDAWAAVQCEARNVGTWGSPRFADPTIDTAVRRIGWRRICQEDDERGYLRRDFERVYRECHDERADRARVATIAGGAASAALPRG